MSERTVEHRLEGLEPENLLAFLALVGAHRALEVARPKWRARIRWDLDSAVPRPVLNTPANVSLKDVALGVCDGIGVLAPYHQFDGRKNLDWSRHEIREIQEAAESDPLAWRLVSSLGSDAAAREDKDEIWQTPLCLMFGQGHQHFLERLQAVPNGELPASLQKRKNPPDLSSPDYIEQTLFTPWLREDPTDGFRWDPLEDRRYALRAKNPSGDALRTQHGANVLAAIAVPMFTGSAIARRGSMRFLTACARYGDDGRIEFVWPLWRPALRFSGLGALLTHGALADPDVYGPTLRRLGVDAVVVAKRISVGKFLNVAPGEVRLDLGEGAQ